LRRARPRLSKRKHRRQCDYGQNSAGRQTVDEPGSADQNLDQSERSEEQDNPANTGRSIKSAPFLHQIKSASIDWLGQESRATQKPLQLTLQRFSVKASLLIFGWRRLARARAKAITRMVSHMGVNRRATDHQGMRVRRITRRNVTNRALIFGSDHRRSHPDCKANREDSKRNEN